MKVKGVQKRTEMGKGGHGCDAGELERMEGMRRAVTCHWLRVQEMANVGEVSLGWVKEALHEVEKHTYGEGCEKGFLGHPLGLLLTCFPDYTENQASLLLLLTVLLPALTPRALGFPIPSLLL